MKIEPTFQSWRCAGQRVFLRADLNVPLINGKILSDRRLRAIQPTLDYLLKEKTQVILASHIGRPTSPDPALSTKHLIPWFESKGYKIRYAKSIAEAQESSLDIESIILLENLRFFPGEKKEDLSFAQQLATLANWYVNDAFATLHRSDTSMTLLAYQYPKNHRSIGFLIETELEILSQVMRDPAHPVCFILGGGKVADKLPLIKHLCSFADIIVLVPALVFTFLKALGKPVGKSLVDDTILSNARSILEKEKYTTTFVFPLDYQIASGAKDGPLSFVDADNFPSDAVGVSIGPKTIAHIQDIIAGSKTIFYNGMMGFPNREETLQGVEAIITAMSERDATTIVAGGESILIIDRLKLKGITHCITGGGATLTYLGGQKLPGLLPFLKDGTKTD